METVADRIAALRGPRASEQTPNPNYETADDVPERAGTDTELAALRSQFRMHARRADDAARTAAADAERMFGQLAPPAPRPTP